MLLTQLLEEHGRAKGTLAELQRECATLREQMVALREENDCYRNERSEVVEKIAAGLDTASDALLRFREGAARVSDAVTAAGVANVPVPVPRPKEPGEPSAPQILVVDDDTSFRSMLTMHLAESRGYAVASAVSGEEALTMLASHQPQAVLLDLMMPGIGGMEALRRMKALYPGLCVVTVTAHEDPGTAHETIALGAVDYLKKPFQLDHLDAVLNIHMTPRPAPQPQT